MPDRFVCLPNRDGHSTWVNSSALEQAGITRDTPDPADGRIERTDDGEPSGTLHEGAAELVGRHAPAPAGEEMAEALLKGQEYLHSLGITAWQDAIVDDHENFGSNYRTYVDAAGRGDLTARVVGALWWDRHRGAEQIEAFVDMRERGRIGRFSPTSIKIMQDGVCENFTAAVIDPYLDAHGESTGNRGISFVDPEALKGYVTELDRLGFQVHYHALAERAVREALDAIEAALAANGASDNWHHLAHIQVVHPDDIPRFRRPHAGERTAALGGPRVADGRLDDPVPRRTSVAVAVPVREPVRAGATLAMGSDWSVSSPDPLEEIHVAVNRRMPPSYPHRVERHDVFIPDERLDLATALAAFTMGSAYVNHLDDTTGSIEVGKFADLTVIDRNLFEHPAEEIADAAVEQTFVEEGARVRGGGVMNGPRREGQAGRRWMRTSVLAAALAATSSVGSVGASASAERGLTYECRLVATKLGEEISVALRLVTNQARDDWRVRLYHEGERIFSKVRTNAQGNLKVVRIVPNLARRDELSAWSRHLESGAVCKVDSRI